MSLSVSSAWDETAALARRDGWRLFGLAFLLLALPSALLRIVAPMRISGIVPGLWLLGAPLLICASLIGALAITHIALTPGAGVAGALRHAFRRLLPLLGAAVLVAIGGTLLALPLLVLMSGVANHAGEDVLLILWLVLLSLGWLLFVLFFLVRLLLMTPVAAVEPLGPLALLQRSWRLTHGHFWRLLGFVFLVLLVSVVVLMAVGAIGGIIVTLIAGRPAPGSLATALILLVSALVQAAISGIFTAFVARLYARLAGAG